MVKVRREVEMEDFTDIGKYLGCGHHVEATVVGGKTLTRHAFEMGDYFRSACDIFVAEIGEALRSGTTSPAPPRAKTAST